MKSILRIELLTWGKATLFEAELNPLKSQEQIFKFVLSKKTKEFLDKCREPCLKQTRSWVADSLPEYEILNACSYGFNALLGLIKDLNNRLNLGLNNFLFNNEDIETMSASLKHNSKELYTSYTKEENFNIKKERIKLDKSVYEEAERRLGNLEPRANFDSVIDHICHNAVKILCEFQDHAQLAWFYDKKDEPIGAPLIFDKTADREGQYAYQNTLLKMIQSNPNIQGLLYCYDAITRDGDDPSKITEEDVFKET